MRNGKVSSPPPAPLSNDSSSRQSVSGTGAAPAASQLPSFSRVERNGLDDGSDFLSPLTPEVYDFSQRRNTPILSRAQIEAICAMTSSNPSRRDSGFSSQRRDTPVLTPNQLRAITEMSKDSVTSLFEGRESVVLDQEGLESPLGNDNQHRNLDSFALSTEFQSILNGLDGDLPKDSRDGANSSLSRLSTHSSSSGFTVDGIDQLLSPKRPKSSETSSASQFFSSNLQFVDTEDSPTSPVWKEPVIRGQAQKTTVVYGDHEDGSSGLVTMIPSSGFFDPSQSQADVLDNDPLPVLDEFKDDKSALVKKGEGESKKKKKAKEGKKSSRRDKLPILPVRSDVSEKIVEEEEEDSYNGSARIAGKKEEKEGRTKKLFGSKRTPSNEFSPLSHVSRLHDFTDEEEKSRALERSASSSSGKKSFSPFRKAKKTSQSFRDDMRESSSSPDISGHFRKFSANSTPSPSRSLGSREGTPESSGSDASGGKQTKKRKTSLAQRIKSLVVGGNSKENVAKSPIAKKPETKAIKKVEVVDNVESSSEFTTSGSNLDIPLSFSGSFEGSGTSVTSSDSQSAKKEAFPPSRPQSAVAAPGSQPKRMAKKQVNDLEMPEVKYRLNLSPRSGVRPDVRSSGTKVQRKSTGGSGGVNAKYTGSPVAKKPSSISSPTAASPRTVTRGTSVPGKGSPISPRSSGKARSETGKGSPSGSPRSSEKRRASSGLGKGSPISSPRSTTRVSTSSPSPTVSPRSSVKRSVSSGKGSPTSSLQSQGKQSPVKIVSPLSQKRVSSTSSPTSRNKSSIAAGTRKASAPTSSSMSPLASSKTTRSPPKLSSSTSSSSIPPGSPKGASAVRKAKATAPTTLDVSPPGSPRVPRSSGQLSSAPSKASPLMLRKVTPSSSGGVTAKSASTSSVTGNASSKKVSVPSTRKAAPPKLTKMSLGAPEVNSPNTKTSPSFSRFSNVRKPLKMNKSPDNSNQPSPVMERSALAESAKPSPLTGISEVTIKQRALSESSSGSSSSRGSQRKRRIGISCSESPMQSPVVSKTFFGESTLPSGKNLPSSSLGLDVESLLASVEKKLGDLTESDATSKQGDDQGVADVFVESSVDLNPVPTSRKHTTRDGSQSPEKAPSPKFSPLLHRKSTEDRKGSSEKVTVVNIKVNNIGVSKQHSSPSITSKSVMKVKDDKLKSTKSPLSTKRSMDLSTKSPKSEAKKVVSSNRPPKVPLTAKVSEPKVKSTSALGKTSTSSMGTTRPRMVVMGDASPKGRPMAKVQSTPLLPASARRESDAGTNVPPEAPKKAPESRRNSILNRSLKSRASTRMIRPGSANVTGRKASVAAIQQQQQQQSHQKQHEKKTDSDVHVSDAHRSSLGPASSRKSMRRVSSGDILKKVRPGSSSTLGRDRRSSLAPPGTLSSSSGSGLGGGMYATMRKSKSSIAPSGFTRSSTTMSMRVPRKLSVAHTQKGNTLRRGSKAGGGLPPAATVADPLALSPSRSSTLKRMSSGGTLRKQSSSGEIMAAFDQISSQAKM